MSYAQHLKRYQPVLESRFDILFAIRERIDVPLLYGLRIGLQKDGMALFLAISNVDKRKRWRNRLFHWKYLSDARKEYWRRKIRKEVDLLVLDEIV